MVKAWLKSVECAGGVCSVECVVSADLVIVTVKVNYNYHKKIYQNPLRHFFKKLYITLTILYVEDCQTTTR